MAAAAAEQRHASAGLAQDPSLLQPPDLLRAMAADGGLDDIPDPTAMTDSQRARMAEELIQRTLAELVGANPTPHQCAGQWRACVITTSSALPSKSYTYL